MGNTQQTSEHRATARMSRAFCVTLRRSVGAEEALQLRADWRAGDRSSPEPTFLCPLCHPIDRAARVGPRHGRHPESEHPGTPHFARFPHEEHTPGCTFGVERIIKELQELSDGALHTERSDGQIGFRLAMPETFTQTQANSDPDAASPLHEQKYTARAAPLLNTAVRVTQMMADLRRAGASLREDFRATCDGTDVDWLSFVYTPRRLHTLARRIELHGPLSHPVAAVFQPTRAGSHPNGSAQHWVRSSLPYDETLKPRGLFVRSHNSSWLPELPVTRGFVAYGMWKLNGRGDDRYDVPLVLRMIDRRSLAPLPDGITCETLDAWASGDSLWERS